MLAVAFLVVTVTTVDVTFVRHAETVANATGKYNGATLNVLSKLGEKQVDELTKTLLTQPKFDLVLVSPSPRAIRTIAPYLRDQRQKAVIFPLLYECCTGRRGHAKATQFSWGSRIAIPDDVKDVCVVRKDWDRYPSAPDYSAGLAQVREALRVLPSAAAGRTLLVGHSGNGGQLLYGLLGKRIQVKNATLIHVGGIRQVKSID